MWDEVRRLRSEGMTVFITTHYLDEADALCDRIAIIDHGQVVAEGTPESLKDEIGRPSGWLTGATTVLEKRYPPPTPVGPRDASTRASGSARLQQQDAPGLRLQGWQRGCTTAPLGVATFAAAPWVAFCPMFWLYFGHDCCTPWQRARPTL
jgi:ABC-type multidrug transport system ATPase subunit